MPNISVYQKLYRDCHRREALCAILDPLEWTASATVSVPSQGILDRHSDNELVFLGLIETATTQRTL